MHSKSPEELEKEAETYFKRGNNFITRILFNTDIIYAADLYIQAAQAYSSTNNYLKAGELFYKAGEIFLTERKEESMYEASSSFLKSAEAYCVVDKEKSVEAYIRSFSVATTHMKDSSMAAIIAVRTAKALREIKKEKEALEYFYKASALYKQSKMYINRRNILMQCAETEMKLKNYTKAFELFKELTVDNSELKNIVEKTNFFFCAILCGIILAKTSECAQLLNKMNPLRIETKIAYQMLKIKTDQSSTMEELDKNLSYFKKTNNLSPEIISAIQDVQLSIDPDNDIL